MKKILISTITAAVLAATSIVPAAAAAPTDASSRWSSQVVCQEWNAFRLQCLEDLLADLGASLRPGNNCPTPETPEVDETPEIDETPEVDETPEIDETPEVDETPDVDQTPDHGGPSDEDQDSSTELEGQVSALEQQVVELVNEQRVLYGLPALALSVQLSDGARLKSQDMASSGYFSHESPNYGTPFEMMQSLGITYRTAGENIAMGYASAEAVVNAWMNSEGHRANILSSSFTQIGVGHVANGNYWTQWFIS